MSSREKFEAWHEDYLKKDNQLHTKWDVWKARDAEVTRLVEALREAQRLISDGYGQQLYGDPYIADAKERFNALLREYDGEKRDAPTNV